jgi:hypothetical protein
MTFALFYYNKRVACQRQVMQLFLSPTSDCHRQNGLTILHQWGSKLESGVAHFQISSA